MSSHPEAPESTNPFEAPRAPITKEVANPKLEQIIAKRMMEAYTQGGPSLGLFLRWNSKKYLIGFLYLIFVMVFLAWFRLYAILLFLLGLILAFPLRDMGWLRRSAKS